MRIAILFVASLAFAGCKKKEETKPAEGAPVAADTAKTAEAPKAEAPKAEDKQADPAGSAAVVTPTAPPPSAAAIAAAAVTSDADYEAKGMAFLTKIGDMMLAANNDCATAAASLNKIVDENGAVFAAINEYEKAHPDAEKAMASKHGAELEAFEGKMRPLMEGCKGHAGLKAAVSRLK